METAAESRALDDPGWVYQVFGLRLHSVIALPDLSEVARHGPPDVRLLFGPARLDGANSIEAEPYIDTDGAACLIRAPVGRLLVADGCVVEIDPAPGAREADLAPYVLGSALAILCHQRGLLPLHASAVAVAGGAVAFVGPSGAGKSTLAAGLSKAGFPVLCDDLCPVAFEAGRPVVRPGVARLKLWPDSLELVGADARGLDPVGTIGKVALAPLVDAAQDGPSLPLLALYSLTTAVGEAPLRRLRGGEAVATILAMVHRWPTARALGLSRRIFYEVAALASIPPILVSPDALDRSAPSARLQAIVASLASIASIV